MTSYNPFDFSKVAYVHGLSRHPATPQTRNPADIFCHPSRSRFCLRLSDNTQGFPPPHLPFPPPSHYTAFL